MKPIISIKEARKILGKEYEHMSDDQVEQLITGLTFIARETIKSFRKQKLEDSQDEGRI